MSAEPISADDQLGQFVAELFRDAEQGELSYLFGKPPNQVSWHGLDVGALVASAQRQPGDVYVPIASRRARLPDGKRGGAGDVLDVFALAADFDVQCAWHDRADLPADIEAAAELFDDWPLFPATAVVVTGGGLQGWWFFAEPHPADEVVPILGRWGAHWCELGRRHGWHVDNTATLDHVFRLPGTVNSNSGAVADLFVADYGRRYGLDDIDAALVEPPVLPRPERGPKPRLADDQRVGGEYNATHSCDDLLEQAGCVLARTDRNGDRHYYAPHRAASRERHGATVYADDGHCAIWSETFATTHRLQTGLGDHRTYDPFGLYVFLQHGGDFTAAARAIHAERAGPLSLATITGAVVPDWVGDADAEAQPAESHPAGFGDEFWHTRLVLTHVRQAAHSRMVSAEALLGYTLARVSALCPPTLVLPATVGVASPLHIIAACVARSGGGKSSTLRLAQELLPTVRDDIRDGFLVGSGEGLADAFLGPTEKVTEPDGTVRKHRPQIYTGLFAMVDEGQVLTELAKRSGSLLLPTLRTAWSGGPLGQENAAAERWRRVEQGRYSFGAVVAIQLTHAVALLRDVDGLAQRVLWLSATDPTVPEEPPDWPGPLLWTPPSALTFGGALGVADSIVAELRVRRRARVRGDDPTANPLDAHRDLLQLRVGALFAVLEQRRLVGDDDWALGGLVLDASDSNRQRLLAEAAALARDAEHQANTRAAQRQVHILTTVAERATERMAKALARKVHKVWDNDKQTTTRGDAWRACKSTDRTTGSFDEALDLAATHGWVTFDGKRLGPGESKPA